MKDESPPNNLSGPSASLSFSLVVLRSSVSPLAASTHTRPFSFFSSSSAFVAESECESTKPFCEMLFFISCSNRSGRGTRHLRPPPASLHALFASSFSLPLSLSIPAVVRDGASLVSRSWFLTVETYLSCCFLLSVHLCVSTKKKMKYFKALECKVGVLAMETCRRTSSPRLKWKATVRGRVHSAA